MFAKVRKILFQPVKNKEIYRLPLEVVAEQTTRNAIIHISPERVQSGIMLDYALSGLGFSAALVSMGVAHRY